MVAPITVRFTAITAPRLDRALASEAIAAEMIKKTYDFCAKAVEELKKYPPPQEGTRFPRGTEKERAAGVELEAEFFEIPRSYNLQRSWAIEPFQPGGRVGGVGFRITNHANESGRILGGKRLSRGHRNYAVWVQGPPPDRTTGRGHQASWHGAWGWPSITTVIDKLGGRAGLRSDLQNIFSRRLGR